MTNQRTLSPFLRPGIGLGAYRFEDTLDACTPRELTIASWNLILQQVLVDPAWAECRSRSLFVSHRRQDANNFFTGRRHYPWVRLFARKIAGGVVTSEMWAYMVGGLSEATAFAIPLVASPGPVLYTASPGWRGVAVPALGRTSDVNLLVGHEVADALDCEFEAEADPSERGIVEVYGFNMIPQFRRLFEPAHRTSDEPR